MPQNITSSCFIFIYMFILCILYDAYTSETDNTTEMGSECFRMNLILADDSKRSFVGMVYGINLLSANGRVEEELLSA